MTECGNRYRMERRFLLIILAASLAFEGVLANQGDKVHAVAELSRKDVSDAGYDFTMALFKELSKQNAGNLFFSPYSISSALSMTMLGTQGTSEMELVQVLGYGKCVHCAEKIHEKGGEIRKEISDSDGVRLTISNRLFPAKSFAVKDSFLARSSNYYGTEVTQLDYANNAEGARNTINAWVERETNDKIRNLLGPGSIKRDTRLVLANAIYFKGKWASEFKPTMTKKRDFYVDKNTPVQVDMMEQTASFRYASNDLFEVIEMPYVGKDTSMVVVLPAKFLSLRQLEKSFTASVLRFLGSYGKVKKVEVQIPKFKLEFETDLVGAIKSMGGTSLFGSSADFGRLTDSENLFISSIVHKAVIEMDEEGTEAAAATAVLLQRRLISPFNQISFKCDRPFFFMLQHNPTNTILFAGRYANPNQ